MNCIRVSIVGQLPFSLAGLQLEEVDMTNKKALDECKRQEKLATDVQKEKQAAEKKFQQVRKMTSEMSTVSSC